MSVLTVVIRDDTAAIHCGGSPSFRSVRLELTDEQCSRLRLNKNEEIDRAFVGPYPLNDLVSPVVPSARGAVGFGADDNGGREMTLCEH